MLTTSVCILGIIFIVSKSSKSYLSCVAFWIPFFFIKDSEKIMRKFPSLERKIFVPGEWNWIDETSSNSTLYFTYTELKFFFLKRRERWGIQKGNSYCKSYLSLPFRSKASKTKCVAMLSSHCLLSFFIKRQCTSYQNNWNQ